MGATNGKLYQKREMEKHVSQLQNVSPIIVQRMNADGEL